MQALAAHEDRPSRKRRWPWIVVVLLVVLAGGGGGYAFAVSRHDGGGSAGSGGGGSLTSCARGKDCAAGATGSGKLTLAKSSPAAGAQTVASNATLTLKFSEPLKSGGPTPSITPSVSGTWHRNGETMAFTPSAPFVPYQKYTVTVPGGAIGLEATDGERLAASATVTFTIAAGSTERLQQLLAQLDYLPVSYAEPSGVAPQDMAQPQAGTMPWRWASLPASLTGQWSTGNWTVVTKGAVMAFETQNGLTVDGIPGPDVWSILLADVAANKANTAPYTYVLVTKTTPEHLTAWVNGAAQFTNIPVNTGVPGAPTTDGTFEVFEHVKASTMVGTNVTGSHYDDPTVPWASYFDGGEALHGFPRAAYGFPQSNGCVEMKITTAGDLWPYTGLGTLVTVVGPTAT